MTDMTIKVGDIVAFKSHPKYQMTVEHIYDNEATCVWFHPTTHDFQRQVIQLKSLIKWG
jgi:hypothetical protein